VHHYRIVCTYGLHRTIVYVHLLYTMVCTMLVRRFDRGVTFVFFCELNIDDHFLPQTSFSSFLSPSASRSTTVSLPFVSCEFEHCWLVVSCRLRFTMMNMVIAVFLSVVATVSYARTVRAARYGSFRAPAVHYRLYHVGTTIRRCPAKWRVSHLFVLRSPCFSF
jgi:hypothetical protein